MKKFGMGFLAVMLVVVLAGCTGGKTLTCTFDEEDMMSGSVTMNFDGEDKLEKYSLETVMDFGMDLGEEYAADMCADFEDQDGVSCEAEVDGTAIKMMLDIDFTKASDEVKEELSGESDNYADIKAELEDEGYECK